MNELDALKYDHEECVKIDKKNEKEKFYRKLKTFSIGVECVQRHFKTSGDLGWAKNKIDKVTMNFLHGSFLDLHYCVSNILKETGGAE